MEDGGAVASVNGGVVICQRVLASLGKCGVEAVQRIGTVLANFVLKYNLMVMMDGQMQANDAVAVVASGVILGMVFVVKLK